MKKSTIYLHEKLIRLGKGMLSAWSQWLDEQKAEVDKGHEYKPVIKVSKQ